MAQRARMRRCSRARVVLPTLTRKPPSAQTAFATNAVVENAFLNENLPSVTYPMTFYDIGNFDEMADWITGPLMDVSGAAAVLGTGKVGRGQGKHMDA